MGQKEYETQWEQMAENITYGAGGKTVAGDRTGAKSNTGRMTKAKGITRRVAGRMGRWLGRSFGEIYDGLRFILGLVWRKIRGWWGPDLLLVFAWMMLFTYVMWLYNH